MIWLLMLIQNAVATFFGRFERASGVLTFSYFGFLSGLADQRHNPDYELYKNSYDLGWQNFERGYTLLTHLFSARGITYETFRLVFLVVFFLLLAFGVSLLTKHVAGIALFYGISSFALDSIQVRNLAATAFIVLAIAALVRIPNRFGKIASIGLLIIGSEMHTISDIFLIVPLLAFIEVDFRKYWNKIVGLVYVVSLLMFSSFRIYFSNFIAYLLGIVSNRSNISKNILNVYTQGTSFKYWAIITMVALIMFSVFGNISKDTSLKDDVTTKVLTNILLVGVLSVLLMAISVDYIRVLRIVSLFFFIFIFNVTEKMLANARIGRAWYILFLTLAYSGLLLYVQLRYVYVVQDAFGYIVGFIDPNIIR